MMYRATSASQEMSSRPRKTTVSTTARGAPPLAGTPAPGVPVVRDGQSVAMVTESGGTPFLNKVKMVFVFVNFNDWIMFYYSF